MEPLTLALFVERFPVFETVAADRPAFVQARLDAAWRRTPSAAWGDKAQDAQGYLAAHLIAIDPHGQPAGLVNKDGTTTFGNVRLRMELEEGPGVAPRNTR